MDEFISLADFIKNVRCISPTQFAKDIGASRGKVLNMIRSEKYFVCNGSFIFKITDKLSK